MLFKSKSGLTLVILYTLLSTVVIYKSLACAGMFCGLLIVYSLFPSGLFYQYIFSEFYLWPGQSSYGEVDESWPFLAVTVTTNIIFYYFLGDCLGRVYNFLLKKIVKKSKSDTI